eukprot:TRINITY_DN341_c6_g1_i1.p1 TRINITY_DN341_c6_g1~~TRINITY_DN341_c6_g1_i1.p1  ORF type:complete len:1130 (-),score=372.09 TRINITY_DN341_c6_g1_i1:108-3497(-)
MTEELPVIRRLRAENAPLSEWRREALSRHADDSHAEEEVGKVLEAALQATGEQASEADKADLLSLLAAQRVGLALEREQPEEAKELLRSASAALDKALEADAESLDCILTKAMHSLAELHTNRVTEAREWQRVELLFTTVLKVDSQNPRAHMGIAVLCAARQRWAKALEHFRHVLTRAAREAPASRNELQQRRMRNLKFAMALCFAGLGREEQTKNALNSVVASNPGAVESLCALAQIYAKGSDEDLQRSMEFLDKAINTDATHPVVRLQLANHAFYCGLDGQVMEGSNGHSPFELCNDLVNKTIETTKSPIVKAEAYYQLGRLRHAQKRNEEACAAYLQCKALQPEHLACLFGFAQTCVALSRLKEALEALEKLRKLKDAEPEVLKLLLYVYLALGDKPQEASAAADQLLKLTPHDAEAWAMRAEAQASGTQIGAGSAKNGSAEGGLEAYEKVANLVEETPGGDYSADPQLWNNLGTLRGLQGDPEGAQKAYAKGLALADAQLEKHQQERGPDAMSSESAKDLLIAKLTLRFNRAWLTETLGQAIAEATQDYIALREEHNWFADSLLRLGHQWRRLGDVERAVQTFREAMKHDPALAGLMSAEAYRQARMYSKAIPAATMAVQKADSKQFHYAHCYLGNLHYEVACMSKLSKQDREQHMAKSLRNFTNALQHDKDSHYAANGIGMIFAQRGKLEFARKTFQSVMQHHGMSSDPSVYINLAHTYMKSSEPESLRKAVTLYERAVKIKPDELTTRLYLAKAWFGLEDFAKCCEILSDAVQIWPGDLLLRYNLAIGLQSHAAMQAKKGRDSDDRNKISLSCELARSAVRLFTYVEKTWATMSAEAQKEIAYSTSAPANLAQEMDDIGGHIEYCRFLTAKAAEMVLEKNAEAETLQERMRAVLAMKKTEEDKRNKEIEEEDRIKELKRTEEQEVAAQLQEETREIQLGRNLEHQQLAINAKPAVQRAPKEPKPKRTKDLTAEGEGGAPARSRGRGKPKKKKKDKKDKKDKKRKRHGEGEESEGEAGDQEVAPDALQGEGAGEAAAGDATMLDKDGALEAELFGEEEDDSGDGKHKKKKKKKDKKDKKDRKRRRGDYDDEGDWEGDGGEQTAEGGAGMLPIADTGDDEEEAAL